MLQYLCFGTFFTNYWPYIYFSSSLPKSVPLVVWAIFPWCAIFSKDHPALELWKVLFNRFSLEFSNKDRNVFTIFLALVQLMFQFHSIFASLVLVRIVLPEIKNKFFSEWTFKFKCICFVFCDRYLIWSISLMNKNHMFLRGRDLVSHVNVNTWLYLRVLLYHVCYAEQN